MTGTIESDANNVGDFAGLRQAMVSSQLRTNAVADPRVVAAMARVPRERFVPGGELAYRDTAVALGGDRFANPPMATGRLLTEARLTPLDTVLLIGAATGYTAAVLAGMVRRVAAVECDPALAARAREALAGTPNVSVIEGDLTRGHVEGAPFDVLLIDGAVEAVPETLVTQLRTGGRIVTGLADRGVTRLAAGRRSEGGSGLVDFADAECVVLPGFARPRGFRF